MPLQRRVPKFGFKNINRKEYKAINIGVLQELAEKKGVDTIDVQFLVEAGVAKKSDLIKILGNGTLTKKLEVKAHAFSKSAIAAIEKAEGSAIKL
jgi:large subunit ribosomal protein L15